MGRFFWDDDGEVDTEAGRGRDLAVVFVGLAIAFVVIGILVVVVVVEVLPWLSRIVPAESIARW